jgi:hypothetical protein
VGRRPETPQKLEGVRIEPQVSEPMANPTSPAAVAAPEPLEEPPAQRVVSQGLTVGMSEALPVV